MSIVILLKYLFVLLLETGHSKIHFMKASSSFSDEQFSLWKTVLVRNFMSSEESAEEDDGVGDKRHILVV